MIANHLKDGIVVCNNKNTCPTHMVRIFLLTTMQRRMFQKKTLPRPHWQSPAVVKLLGKRSILDPDRTQGNRGGSRNIYR
jgi:hypothetical protein